MSRVPVTSDFSAWPCAWVLFAHRWFPVVALIFLCSCPSSSASGPDDAKKVLLFQSFSGRIINGADPIESELQDRLSGPVDFYVEYWEGRGFDDEVSEKDLLYRLQHKYRGQPLDLVMTRAYPAFQFVLRHRDELFPGVPIIFWAIDIPHVVQKMLPGVTGVELALDIPGTIGLALHLHPNTTTIAIVANNSEFERYWVAAVHAELVKHQSEVKEIDLIGLSPPQLLESVATLPPKTVVLYQAVQEDSIQHKPFPKTSIQPGAYETLPWIGQHFPTYCIFPEVCLNHGGIGGFGYVMEEHTGLAADLARRVLSGERNIPVVNDTLQQVRVDWRQLNRWHIPESALPPGTIVLYREPTLWERGRKYFFAALAIIVLQALLIFGLFWQRARKRKAEAVLRESEKRFQVMADTTPSLIWMCDQEGKVTYLNDQRVAFTGLDQGAGYDDTWTAYVHPDDLKDVQDALTWALKSRQRFSKEYRLRRHDGVYRWMLDIASPRANGDGSFVGFIGSAIDISDQKLAQEALQTVGGRLLEAQEEERKRIARELHDDISQKLALLSMELAQANRGANEATKERLNDIRQHCSGIAKDIQSLSHQLHYSKLDYLGLVGAVKGFCREFGKQYDVSVDFKDENVPRQLPKQISLCLFRVAQEALHNAVKYSGAQEYKVKLSATKDELQLVVSDAGTGFDVAEAIKTQGLGLVSMQERVHLVNGRFHIESRPGEGTIVSASVPVIAMINGGASADAGHSQPGSVPGAA